MSLLEEKKRWLQSITGHDRADTGYQIKFLSPKRAWRSLRPELEVKIRAASRQSGARHGQTPRGDTGRTKPGIAILKDLQVNNTGVALRNDRPYQRVSGYRCDCYNHEALKSSGIVMKDMAEIILTEGAKGCAARLEKAESLK